MLPNCVYWSMQAPNQVTILMDDGFSVVQYTFHLREVGPDCTSVLCEVRL